MTSSSTSAPSSPSEIMENLDEEELLNAAFFKKGGNYDDNKKVTRSKSDCFESEENLRIKIRNSEIEVELKKTNLSRRSN